MQRLYIRRENDKKIFEPIIKYKKYLLPEPPKAAILATRAAEGSASERDSSETTRVRVRTKGARRRG